MVASTVSGVVPNVFWMRIRSASPPWLRWVIIRTDWLSNTVLARRCWDCAQEVNHVWPAAASADRDTATAPAANVAAATSAAVRRLLIVTEIPFVA